MFPPGRVIFLRPIKLLDPSERRGEDRGVKTVWDAVWTTPQEIIGEGILVSPKMLSHHSITGALTEALGYCSRHHPNNPKSEEEKRQDKQEEQDMANELHDIRVDGADTTGALDILSRSSQSSE